MIKKTNIDKMCKLILKAPLEKKMVVQCLCKCKHNIHSSFQPTRDPLQRSSAIKAEVAPNGRQTECADATYGQDRLMGTDRFLSEPILSQTIIWQQCDPFLFTD